MKIDGRDVTKLNVIYLSLIHIFPIGLLIKILIGMRMRKMSGKTLGKGQRGREGRIVIFLTFDVRDYFHYHYSVA